MALNSFQFTGGANVSVGPTPLAVQIVGPTVVVTNIGALTVYGSLGGSTSISLNPGAYLSGAPAPAGNAPSTATGVGGFSVLPGQQIALAAGANGFLWLATLAGQSAVNVANGT